MFVSDFCFHIALMSQITCLGVFSLIVFVTHEMPARSIKSAYLNVNINLFIEDRPYYPKSHSFLKITNDRDFIERP